MKYLRLFFGTCFLAFAPVMQAQIAVSSEAGPEIGADSPANGLPLRNLQIEVRQVEQDSRSRERLDAAVAARVQAGQSGAAIGVNAQSQQSGRSDTAQQQVLVLNGRRAAIVLRNSVSLRVLQTLVRHGVPLTVPGTIWLEAGTGFDAIPRWNGGDTVELELAAMQAQGTPPAPSSATATLLLVPLGEWVTVAQSDQDQRRQQSGLDGISRASSQTRLEVQVRVRVR